MFTCLILAGIHKSTYKQNCKNPPFLHNTTAPIPHTNFALYNKDKIQRAMKSLPYLYIYVQIKGITLCGIYFYVTSQMGVVIVIMVYYFSVIWTTPTAITLVTLHHSTYICMHVSKYACMHSSLILSHTTYTACIVYQVLQDRKYLPIELHL